MVRPVGRPNLPYATRHVMLNLRTEYYVKLKNAGKNMSLLVNNFLHAVHQYTICPLCYTEDVHVHHCHKCEGRALFCQSPSCKKAKRAQMRDCKTDPETGVMCTPKEFKGETEFDALLLGTEIP